MIIAAISKRRILFPSLLIIFIWLLSSGFTTNNNDEVNLKKSVFDFSVKKMKNSVKIITPNYIIQIRNEGFRYQLLRPDGTVITPEHAKSGIQYGLINDIDLNKKALELAEEMKGRTLDVIKSIYVGKTVDAVNFKVTNQAGEVANVQIFPALNRVRFSVKPVNEGVYNIVARTGGTSPLFGLSDHGGLGRNSVDITGFLSEYFGARTAQAKQHLEGRLISNFVISPKNGFAAVNVEPRKKIVRTTNDENAQGSSGVREMQSLYYFIGTTSTIYNQLHQVRTEEGYPFFTPKYELFGVGWEAFGALGWKTNAKSVQQNIETYLSLGYPLSWMVIGSGFWPSDKPELWGTTSFGMWNDKLYPNPRAFLKNFKDNGFTVLLGLRIAFKQGNPYALEAERLGYLIKNKEGKPENFQDSGKGETYLIDFENPNAVQWYVEMSKKWLDYGVDGFKEDLMFFLNKLERDDKVDPINQAFMKEGVHIIGRNMYFGSSSDLHRFNDLNADEGQDRGPINGLAFAFSGFPFVYPDIVGGTDIWKMKAILSDKQIGKYLMRYAYYAAVNPSMSFGYGPWNINDPYVVEVTRNAALLHERLQPYIYSYALKTSETGFPFTMTPLPLVYPNDSNAYKLLNKDNRGYQWLIGESLLATPLYGEDYNTAMSRDIYIPDGKWIQYDTGEVIYGPQIVKNYPLPFGLTPLFVGGKGIVIEQEWEQLFAHIYPIQHKTSMKYQHRNKAESIIEINVDSWENQLIKVIDKTKEKNVRFRKNKHSIVFPIEPGNDYLVYGESFNDSIDPVDVKGIKEIVLPQ
jgi:alpha-glucosidase (family GH31 glycosyl hydrolase)